MASVPQTAATHESFSTLVAELYGDQPTPAPQSPADRRTTDDRWHDAVTQVGEQLRAKLRVDVLPERLNKALALVLAHAVTLHPDGTACVQSRTQTYTLAPDCPCADATHRTEFCKHHLAVELHRRALALLDGTAPASTSGAALTDAQPSQPAPGAPDAVPGAPASAGWHVHEAPTSSCFKIRVGTLEWMHTIRASDDAELHTRLQAFLPTFRAIAAALEALHAEREAAKAAPAAPAAATAPADLQVLIQQAVQQALAAQAASQGTALANDTASSTPSAPPSPAPEASAVDDQETGFCSLHHVSMKAHTDPATGDTWHSHWLEEDQRYCRGRRPRRHGRTSRR